MESSQTVGCSSDWGSDTGPGDEAAEPHAAEKAYTVLLVEDDAVVCKLVARLLEKCSYKVLIARDGREALDTLERPEGARVDVILTDNLMPKMTGVELVYQVVQQQKWRHVPVIVMSSETKREVVLEAFAAGAVDFLIKPIRRNELTTLWHHVWRKKNTPSGCPTPLTHKRHTRVDGRDRKAAATEDSQLSAQTPAGDAFSFQKAASGAQSRKRSPPAEQPPTSKRTRICEAATSPVVEDEAECQAGEAIPNDTSVVEGGEEATVQWAPRPQQMGRAISLPAALQSQFESATSMIEKLARAAKLPTTDGASQELPEIEPLDLSRGRMARASSLETGLSQQWPVNASFALKSAGHGVLQQLKQQCKGPALAMALPRPMAAVASTVEGKSGANQNGARPVSDTQPAAEERRKAAEACAANRRAAIAKFRAKRNQRSFEKRVRYKSRQRLATSRPRVRGQFVKAEAVSAAS